MQQEQETQHARRQAVEAMQERDQALSLAEQAFVERDDALALRDAALATAQQLTKERSLGQHFEFSFCVNSSKKKRDVYEVAELLVKAAVALSRQVSIDTWLEILASQACACFARHMHMPYRGICIFSCRMVTQDATFYRTARNLSRCTQGPSTLVTLSAYSAALRL